MTPKQQDGRERSSRRASEPSARAERLADIEGAALGLLFGYETLAILLRKTRWTDKVPPITRKIIQLPEYVEDAILSAFKLHFIWHRRTQ